MVKMVNMLFWRISYLTLFFFLLSVDWHTPIKKIYTRVISKLMSLNKSENISSLSQNYIHFMEKNYINYDHVATPLWVKCEDETHTPKSGNLESSGTPENSKLKFKGQNTSHWGVFYTIGKVLKCECPKWPRISHLDICSTSYGRKKGRESNWQFDSRPLKVKNRVDSGAFR
jgi:hypothetical protein